MRNAPSTLLVDEYPLPVALLHVADDPHPGKRIRDSLAEVLPQLEYHQWERCGHYPWMERAAREPFFSKLIQWLDGRRR